MAVRVVLADVDVHAAGAEQSDDITVLAVRFQGPDTEVTGSFDIAVPNVPADPLKFRDRKRYADRLKEAQGRTGRSDAIEAAHGKIDDLPVVIAVMSP